MKATLFRLSCLLGCLFLASCVKNDDATGGSRLPQDGFDFSTTGTYLLDFSYDIPKGYEVFFELFDRMPVQEEDGVLVRIESVKPVARGYTDAEGRYRHPITLPATVNDLYLYSTAVGVPHLLQARVEGKAIVLTQGKDAGAKSAAMHKSAVGIANGLYCNPTWSWTDSGISYADGLLCSNLGRPEYLLEEELDIPGATLRAINEAFTDGRPVNKKYFTSTDIHVTKDAHVDLYFIDENTANNNVLAYYEYPTGQKPASVSEIDRFMIAFPNARKLGYHRFPAGFYGALSMGEGIRLQHWNGTELVDVFPEGTSIGWVLCSDGYAFPRGNGKAITNGYGRFYSDPQFNPEVSGEKNHVALFRKDDFVVFGFEDYFNNKGDGDCNDVIFHVKSDPVDAITDNVPEVDENPKDPTREAYTMEYEGTLAFEDVWPYQGDYDMNDVVVRYRSVISYNYLNEALGTEDTFTLLWSGAAYRDGFAYELNTSAANIELVASSDGGHVPVLVAAGDKAVIRVLVNALDDSADNTRTPTYTVTTRFRTPVPMDRLGAAPYNPFITVNGDLSKEIHLPYHAPTALAERNWFGKGLDISDAAKGNWYTSPLAWPFAIHITGSDEFVISPEKVRIDATYPQFEAWVASGGKENRDWYRHPANR